MIQVKVIEDKNILVGALIGDVTSDEGERYYEKIVESIPRLKEGWTYIFDVSNFYPLAESTNERMGELRKYCDANGLGLFCLVGSGMKTFMAIKEEEQYYPFNAEAFHFQNTADAMAFVEKY